MSELLEGVQLSDFLLVKCISRGGVADVYQGRQVSGGNYEVAVKIYRSGYAQRESFREYFMSEAEKIGQLEHPNILPFLEFGEGEGLLYAVTPFVATGSLEDLLVKVGGKFSAMQALPSLQQLSSAVQYAHEHDVIHGNIKPSNVFVAADGRMLLADFGIVRGFDDSQESLTRIGWGTAEYAAPEQSLGVLRKASDIYALGALLFRVLTGRPPFTGQTPVEVLLKHVRQQAPSARSFDPSISDTVDSVLLTALRKRSDDRYASAQEFCDALMAAVTVAPVASPVARPVPLVTRPLTQSQPLPVDHPHTPIPTSVTASPQPVVTPTQVEPFDFAASAISPFQEHSSVKTSGDDTGRGANGRGGRHFLQDDEDGGTHLFWSSGPVEWSPIGSESQSAPLTASEYLRSAPVAPDAPDKLPATGPKQEAQEMLPVKSKTGQPKRWSKKALPILIVALLLIGLLGALFSSFLFTPSPGAPSSGSTNNSSSATNSATATISISPTSGVTATPTAKVSPTAAKTQPTPSPTLIPIPANPPIPTFACANGSLNLDGSLNFNPAIQQLTTDYGNQCSGSVAFTVTTGDSQTALDALANGSVDLAASDLPSSGRAGLVDYQVAALIFAVVVNSDTQVTRLTSAQLQGIYSGQITNWSQVGGSNEPIVILTQPATSTLRAVFESFVLHGATQGVSGVSTSSSVQNVTGAITYMPLSQAPADGSGAQVIAINGVSPSSAAVASGAYSFWTIEHLYTNRAAQGTALSFISFCMTANGAGDLASSGAVPYKNMSSGALRSHLPGPTV